MKVYRLIFYIYALIISCGKFNRLRSRGERVSLLNRGQSSGGEISPSVINVIAPELRQVFIY